MARNEEKQQGKLNRLWLQKEKEEGRIKVHERRPRLSSLTSAASVKKWIPSITKEMEYYLQSQLSHYPERKIAEFQLQIQALEKQYKSFVTKLRLLDPSCKHKPGAPRAYCKRRADTQDTPSKAPQPCESLGGRGQWTGAEKDLGCIPGSQGPLSHSVSGCQTPVPSNPISKTSEAACADQDRPLSFDHTRLAVAAAAYRGPLAQQGCSQTLSLARVLQSGLPNIVNASFTYSTQSKDMEDVDRALTVSVVGQESAVQGRQSDCETAEKKPGTAEQTMGHVLGLDCYSSSDEEGNS